jgi:hypothetical protein
LDLKPGHGSILRAQQILTLHTLSDGIVVKFKTSPASVGGWYGNLASRLLPSRDIVAIGSEAAHRLPLMLRAARLDKFERVVGGLSGEAIPKQSYEPFGDRGSERRPER